MHVDFDDLQMGDVVEVQRVLDRRGRNPKKRPVVIVDDAIGTRKAIAVSTQFPEVPITIDTHVPLPWNAQGTTRTGLNQRSVAICDWAVGVTRSNYVRKFGDVSDDDLNKILDRVERLAPQVRTNP